MNMTLVDAYEQGKKLGKGGTHAKSTDGLTMYQNVWHTYQLQHPYLLNAFSRLQFTLQMTGEADFVGICLTKELHNYDAAVGSRTACIHLFGEDFSWADSGLPVIPFNIALEKTTKQNSLLAPYEPNNAVDGDLESVTSSDLVLNPYWEVDLEGEYMIGSIVLHKNTDYDYNFIDDLSNMSVIAYDNKNTKTYHSQLFTMSEDVKTLNFPLNTVASRVVINLIDEKKRMLSLKEVEIFPQNGTVVGREHRIDIPIGSLFSGSEVNFVTFVQGSSNTLLVSQITKTKFLYGSSPDLLAI